MKFLDYLFHGKELRYIDSYFKMLNGYSPTFTSYNGGVYSGGTHRFYYTYRGRVRAALWLVSIESATLRSRRGSRAGVFTVSVCKWRAWSYRV